MKSPHFIQRLESLRGVAAIMVAASHALNILALGDQAALAWWLGLLGNGYAAVTLFFVLSGFVLGLAIRRFEGGWATEFWRYSIRRALRIYPAFLCTTFLILAWLYTAMILYPGQTLWFNHVLQSHHGLLNSELPITSSFVIRSLLLLDPSLNLVTWTLKAETGCSLLLPLLHWLVRRRSGRGKLLVLLGLVWLAYAGKWLLLLGCPRLEALFESTVLKFVFLFYLGYLLPEAGPPLLARLKERRGWSAFVLLGATALFLCANVVTFGTRLEDLRIVQGLAAWVVLAFLLYGPDGRCFKVLDHPVAKFYGTISYSFYLLHDLTLVVAARFFVHFVPATVWSGFPLLFAGLLWLLSTAAATPLAWVFYSCIEKPFIDFSKRAWPRLSFVKSLSTARPRAAA